MAPFILQDELINDANNDNPTAGLKGSLRLKDRFKFRLSRMLGRSVVVDETQDAQTLHIHIGPTRGATLSTTPGDDRTRKFLEDLQNALRNIAWCPTEGPQKAEAFQDQWDIILVFVSSSIHDTIVRLQATFKDHVKKYNAVVTQIFGLDDVDGSGSSLDTDLGDLVIKLQQLANSYGGTVKQQNELIEFAWYLLQHCTAADVRLRCLLGSTFSTKLYKLICELTHPLGTHHTLARTASTFLIFRTVSIHGSSPPTASLKAISGSLKTSCLLQEPQALQLRKHSPPPRNATPPKGTMIDTIRSYLPKEDRELGLLRLQPASKQAAARLIGCVLHSVPVPPRSDTYYFFGFTTCRDKKEESDLADYYRQLLNTSLEPPIVFASINKALEYGTLAGLLRNNAGQNLERYYPALQQFLTAQHEKRFSVHRLVQFVRDEENDEPLACLKRDFGFKFCTQREHVAKLKALYASIIDKAGPGKLHYACIFGRLLDHAICTLGFVEPSMRRLLQNDYPNPSVGYDNSRGLEKYMMPLFKRTLGG